MEGPLSPDRDPEPDDRRVVCHVDMDCFYAACERLREPALTDEPLVVGMGYEPSEDIGAVATASYEAREYGVESAMPISEALELLPRKVDAARDDDLSVADAGFYRPVDMDFYESVSHDVRGLLHDAVETADPDGTVREVSIDEAYLDVSAVGWTDARAFAADLRERIEASAGVTASVGVASNMSTAKVASDHDKPDGLVVVRPDEVRAFLAPLPVDELHGVGPVTEAELRSRGRAIYRHARGVDDREVEPVGKPKSLSSEKALSTTDEGVTKRELVERLAVEVADRARSKGALYKTIGVKVVTPPFDVHTRARSLPGPVDDPDLVEEVARDLLAEFDDDRVRKLGVRVSNLDFAAADQPSLASWERDEETEQTVSEHTRGEAGRDTRGQTTFGDFDA
ncbi:DNA polymerase IV [Halobacteriales archaeon QS_9_67_17]|nr:MAG: DNA polymerase IV [Halobacteriales archaeon QS_9_67_17]